jgi:peptidoglycan/xylan/chitin deacetylase (PgdA/CDA1 family)
MKASWWRRPLTWVVAIVLAAVIIFTRRWVHHAQLELIPVIVPQDVAAADLIHPTAREIASRMLLEVEQSFKPPQRTRLAVLTFDDGPFPVETPLLLAQLQALKVPAVFFLIGRDAQTQPAITLRVKAAGIEIGNHTLTHPELTLLSAMLQRQEIDGGARELQSLTGQRPQFFRPPHGNYNAQTIDVARELGQTMVLWDIDPGDWRSISADTIVASVTSHARSPAVILLHNGKEATIEALPRIVRAYRAAGFEFVTLSQLCRRLPLASINDPIRVSLK